MINERGIRTLIKKNVDIIVVDKTDETSFLFVIYMNFTREVMFLLAANEDRQLVRLYINHIME